MGDNKDKAFLRHLKYYSKNKELVKQKSRDWYSKNKDRVALRMKNDYLKKRFNPDFKYKKYKLGARERGISFELTKEEFLKFWLKPCFYCKDIIKTIGLDRIDNNKGYTLKNVVPCCKVCNKMKSTMSQDEFLEKCYHISILSSR